MRALLSVYDKTNMVPLAQGLSALDYEIISTGGTYQILKSAGLQVTYISEITGFPEILDGRVKTLHPLIHGGILATESPEHQSQLVAIGGAPIDLVAVNLYPFEAVSANPNSTFEQVMENIDIGGPTLLRAAAKNHQRVIVLSDPRDYQWVLEKLQDRTMSIAERKRLAGKAFAHTAYYDSLISRYLDEPEFPETTTLPLKRSMTLRYGENPHQKAALYQEVPGEVGITQGEQLQGKMLSFNNILDSDAAWQMVSQFDDPCVVAVKHSNPCGISLGSSLLEAYQKTYEADPISIFGGIVACNRVVDGRTAVEIGRIFLEVVIAPDFDHEALRILSKKENLRLIRLAPAQNRGYDWKTISGGFLVQQRDDIDFQEDQLQVVTKRQPTQEEWQGLRFAMKCVKYVKSNAIVVCLADRLLGVGAGQMNRVQSMRLACGQAGKRAKGAVVGSDAFFPFADNIEEAAKAGITGIIQPGGSIRDREVIACCDDFDMTMVFTGIRHFRH